MQFSRPECLRECFRVLFQRGGRSEGWWPRGSIERSRFPKLLLGAFVSLAIAGSAPASPLPSQDLGQREAQIWYLGHSGWAIQTESRFLIFDYQEQREPAVARSLGNGYIDPGEISNLSVVVFVSHGHGDHWDRRILEWKETIPDITYVFGWRADQGAGQWTEQGAQHVYCDFERQELALGSMRVRTIVHDFDGIPEAAFIVDLDGITLFHSGDHGNGPPPFREQFVDNLEYVANIAPEIDLAFIPMWGEESFVVETLKPKYTFPMHDLGREHEYARFATRARAENLPTEVIAAAARGDHFLFSDGGMRVLRNEPR